MKAATYLSYDKDPRNRDYVRGVPENTTRRCSCDTWKPRVFPPDVRRAWCGDCGGWLLGGPKGGKKNPTVPRDPGRPTQQRCKRGHSLKDAYVTPSENRKCRVCARERERDRRHASVVRNASAIVAAQGVLRAEMGSPVLGTENGQVVPGVVRNSGETDGAAR